MYKSLQANIVWNEREYIMRIFMKISKSSKYTLLYIRFKSQIFENVWIFEKCDFSFLKGFNLVQITGQLEKRVNSETSSWREGSWRWGKKVERGEGKY